MKVPTSAQRSGVWAYWRILDDDVEHHHECFCRAAPHARVKRSLNTSILEEMSLVLVGGAILPAPSVTASTRISAGLKRVQERSSLVSLCFDCAGNGRVWRHM